MGSQENGTDRNVTIIDYANGGQHYSDIDRNHAVDFNDLKILTEEWLFQGCDPNTFVKSNYINKLAPLLDKGYRLASLPDKRHRLVKNTDNLEGQVNRGYALNAYDEQKARMYT